MGGAWWMLLLLSFAWTSAIHIYEPPGPRFVVLIAAALLAAYGGNWIHHRLDKGKAWRSAGMEAGFVALAQGAVVPFYKVFAARIHRESLFAALSSPLLRLFGIQNVREGSTLYLDTYRHTMVFVSAPEKTGLLYLLFFLVGGIVLLAARKATVKRIALYPCFLFLYGVLRYTFLILLSASYYIHTMFWEGWITLFSFIPLVLFLSWWCRKLPAGVYEGLFTPHSKKAAITAGTMGFLLVFFVTAWFGWRDYGKPKQGRVLVDEYHSDWEWTTEAYDTNWFGERSGYNYYCFFDYIGKFYQSSLNLDVITKETLENVDVFIIKTPTLPFEEGEIDAILSFVDNGGGLYLIGDHTNVFGTSTNLNSISKAFGIRYNLDCTYELVNGTLSEYDRPQLMAHPSVARLPHFLFATSCTLEATWKAEEIMLGYGLKNYPVNYSQRNFFPEETNGNDIEFGLFLQSAGISYGKGRVVAYSDSTVFSNFWMYMPGKPELLLLTLEWLNRDNQLTVGTTREIATCAIVVMLVICLVYLLRSKEKAAGVMLLGGICGCAVGALLFTALARAHVQLPEPKKPMVNIYFDREYAQFSIPDTLAGFLDDVDKQFSTFYVWTQRLGYYPQVTGSLMKGLEAGELTVVTKPKKAFRNETKIIEKIEAGGKLLILDNMDTGAYANSLLSKVGMAVVEAPNLTEADYGDIQGIRLTENASAVTGGIPLMTDKNGQAILSVQRVGQGLIAVFTDPDLLYNLELGDVSANLTDRTQALSAVEFKMIETLIEDY